MQHPRPIRSLVDDAAPSSVEMTQGVTPPQPRYRAPFHQSYAVTPPDVPVFSIEMVAGAHPDRARLFLAPRIPLPVSQTTHTEATFGPEMVAGSIPVKNRAFVYPKLGWSVSQTTHVAATFSIEMSAGVAPPRFRYRAPSHQGEQWWTPEVEAFGIEQVIGSKPDRNRHRLGPRIGQPSSQVTHTSAPFSIEMVIGARPFQGRPRNDVRMRAGWFGPMNPGPDVTPVTEVTSGPHRYKWEAAHDRAQAWPSHERSVTWDPHRRKV